MNKRYRFTIVRYGCGKTPDSAWSNCLRLIAADGLGDEIPGYTLDSESKEPGEVELDYLTLVRMLEELVTSAQFVDETSQLEYASICTAVKALWTFRDWGNEVSDASVSVEVR